MKTSIITLIALLLNSVSLICQNNSYDIEKNRILYTVGYAHLDTEWNWDYPTTINVCLKNTMEENFYLFGKYPEYTFNFTGSRRYKMMKEYYPELYKKVVDYVKKDRWHVSGSSVDEGEVNVSSPESVIRQVLYGNNYFKREFGKESYDYMLPDCFGFQANMPSIWHHCGLLGFSTQKLTWNSASGLPFNVGIWNGPDGKGIIAALNADSYVGNVENRLDLSKHWNGRIDDNQKKYGILFDYRYYGVGDEGGAPRENDVRNAVGSLNNTDSKLKVLLSSSDQMYRDITPEIRKKLPVYSGDLLLIEHSAGSQTSQAFMKRANRKNELMAYDTELTSSFADCQGIAKYPFDKINNSWELVLGSQFHDILPGTSIPKAYEYAWNDEFIAANGFSTALNNSLEAISNLMNTNVQGRALIVHNPVAIDREDIVTAQMEYAVLPESIAVFDINGKQIPAQIIERKDNTIKFIFSAKIPSTGFTVFDIRESKSDFTGKSSLKCSSNTLENEYYLVQLASNGNINSIFDKKTSKELLKSPATLEFLEESPEAWPSWNMDWADRQKPPVDHMDKEAEVSVFEAGPVRVSLLVKRKGMNSEIEQIISLAAGEAGKRIEVANKLDWQSKGVSLKASFPFTAGNENATYNLGVGTVERGNNNKVKFEVPSREWIDLTDRNRTYGISLLEDCKYGSDKPDDNTLRLTLVYSPQVSKSFSWCWYQAYQDWGIHDFKYAIYGHKDSWETSGTQWQAKFLNQPLISFEASKHDGKFGKEFSILKNNNPSAGIMAFKKMENGDYYVLRVNELTGKDHKYITISLPGQIIDAFEINGQEKKIGEATFNKNKLIFDLEHYTIKSFAFKMANPEMISPEPGQYSVTLPYNADLITNDLNRFDCHGEWGGHSYPAELIPPVIISEDINFKTGNTADRSNNAVVCEGQVIELPQGKYNKIYILASATEDTEGEFTIGELKNNLHVQSWTGYIGQYYNRIMNPLDKSLYKIEKPFVKPDNIAWYASHFHNSYPTANEAYQYSYLFKYEFDIPSDAKTITLPSNKKIRIFAATVVNDKNDAIRLSEPLFDDFKSHGAFILKNN